MKGEVSGEKRKDTPSNGQVTAGEMSKATVSKGEGSMEKMKATSSQGEVTGEKRKATPSTDNVRQSKEPKVCI